MAFQICVARRAGNVLEGQPGEVRACLLGALQRLAEGADHDALELVGPTSIRRLRLEQHTLVYDLHPEQRTLTLWDVLPARPS